MQTPKASIPLLLLSAMLLSGCAALALGTAGGVAGSELTEDDERFDPLENTEVGKEVYEEVY